MHAPPRSATSYAALAILSAAVLGLPLARGAVFPSAVACAVALTLLSCALALWSNPVLPRAGLALSFTLLGGLAQLAPVSATLHGLSPAAREVFETSLEPLRLYPAARPLSLDPPATLVALAQAAGFVAAFLAASTFSRSHRRLRLLGGALGISGVLVAGLVVLLALAGEGVLVEPRWPFANRNHLAALLDLATLILIGLALDGRRLERTLWLAGAVLTAAVALLSLSRSGLAGLGAGLLTFAFLRWRHRDRHREHSTFWGPASLLLLAAGLAVTAAALLAPEALLARLHSVSTVADEPKPQVWAAGLRLLRSAPWTGIGRGAFPFAFPPFKPDPSRYTYTHVENHWLQLLIDLGFPLGLSVLGILMWIWISASRQKPMSSLRIGLLAGTAAVAIHDLADFSLDLAGIGIPFAVALGLAYRPHRVFRPRPWVIVTGVAGVAIAAMTALAGGYHESADLTLARLQGSNDSELLPAAIEAARRHPADALVHAATGVRLANAGRCAEATPWLERAALLSPTEPLPHRVLGRCLARSGDTARARLEYRLAISYGDPAALDEAAATFSDPQSLLAAVPDSPEELRRAGNLLAGDRPELAAALLQRALDDYGDETVLLPLAELRLRRGEATAALDLATQKLAHASGSEHAHSVAYRALWLLGRQGEASALLDRALDASPGSGELLELAYARAFDEHRYARAKGLAEQIVPRSIHEATRRELLVARALSAQGRQPEAVLHARSASELEPESAAILYELAELQVAAGQFAQAIDSLERCAALPDGEPDRARKRIAEIRTKASQQDVTRLLEAGGDTAGTQPH